MLNSRLLFLLILAAACTSCKMPVYQFNVHKFVDSSFQKRVPAYIVAGDNDVIIDGKMYTAILAERPVYNNAVADFKLLNKHSKQNVIDFEADRYRNELYFYELRSANDLVYGILLTATFFGDTTCIGVGPLYLGNIGPKPNHRVFTLKKEFTVTQNRDKTLSIRPVKGSPNLRLSYTLEQESSKTFVNFFRILHSGKNKISGMTKPLVYEVPTVFGDSNALRFESTPNK